MNSKLSFIFVFSICSALALGSCSSTPETIPPSATYTLATATSTNTPLPTPIPSKKPTSTPDSGPNYDIATQAHMTYPFEASLNGASINITLVMDHSVFTDTGPKHYDYLKPHPLFHNPNNNDDAQGGIARTIWITRWNMWKLGAPQRQNISLVDYLKIHADNPFNDVNETTITQRDTVIVFLDPNSANGNRLLTQIKIDARVSIFWGEHVIGGKLFFFVPTISPGGNPSMGVATDFLGCALTRAYSSRTSDFLDG